MRIIFYSEINQVIKNTLKQRIIFLIKKQIHMNCSWKVEYQMNILDNFSIKVGIRY